MQTGRLGREASIETHYLRRLLTCRSHGHCPVTIYAILGDENASWSAMAARGVVIVIPAGVATMGNQRRGNSRSPARSSQTMSTPRTSKGVVRPCVTGCFRPGLRRTVRRGKPVTFYISARQNRRNPMLSHERPALRALVQFIEYTGGPRCTTQPTF